MADIHIHEKLDKIDYISVFLYRISFICYALMLLMLGFSHWLPFSADILIPLLCFNSLLSACCMHIYDKNIRWMLLGASLFAMLCATLGAWSWLSLGASLVTLCGLSIKEYYCFRLPVIRITPLVLILFWFVVSFFANTFVSQGVSFLSCLLLLTIGIAKLRQPFDFDIGDKSKFQI